MQHIKQFWNTNNSTTRGFFDEAHYIKFLNNRNKMKNKETLEEYISEVTKNFGDEMSIKFTSGGIKLGAKWQSERMYSEEEVLKLLINFSDDRTFLKKNVAIKWFEQFKNK